MKTSLFCGSQLGSMCHNLMGFYEYNSLLEPEWRAPHDRIFKKCLFEHKITCDIEICIKLSHLENYFLQKGVPIFVASWAYCAYLAG